MDMFQWAGIASSMMMMADDENKARDTKEKKIGRNIWFHELHGQNNKLELYFSRELIHLQQMTLFGKKWIEYRGKY